MGSLIGTEDKEEWGKMGFKAEALKTWRRMQRHENELCLKRKYLMGLSELDSTDQDVKSCNEKQLVFPESMLRKDDIFYEDVVKIVEKSFFQAPDTEATHNVIGDDDAGFCEVQNMSKFILTLLDDLSNYGMYSLAKILTRGSVTFCRTRPQMRRVIKNNLQNMHSNRLDCKYHDQMKNELAQLLKNPNNFRQNYGKHIKLTRKSLDSAFNKVHFQSIPVRILYAMYRRLKGRRGVMPQLRPSHSGWKRDRLINQVRKLWLNMISQLDESDKLQDTLVKVLAVPALYAKLEESEDLSLAHFLHVSPEMEALQNELVKAIRSLGLRRFKKEELEALQRLLDPESNVDVNGLRRAIKNMLIDCLVECSDMEVVPESLLDALSIINKKACKVWCFSKEVIEEEVECILNVGAHIKQLVWDYLPLDKIDSDFDDAYMEELEESDDGDIFDGEDDDDQQLLTNFMDEVQIRFNDFNEEVASTRDADYAYSSPSSSTCNDKTVITDEIAFSSSFSVSKFIGCDTLLTAAGDDSSLLVSPVLQGNGDNIDNQDPLNNASVEPMSPVENCSKQTPIFESQRNRYVAIQEVCDQTSLIAHQLIGQVLADFGQKDASGLNRDNESYLRGNYARSENFGDSVDSKDESVSGSVLLRAVHKVIPLFPSRELEIVKNFMNS